MINFLKETMKSLTKNGKTSQDVNWVGFKDKKMTWDNFVLISNFEYDNGLGLALIPENLLVVGKDWWLERHEYDGYEWWEFKKLPEGPQEFSHFIEIIKTW